MKVFKPGTWATLEPDGAIEVLITAVMIETSSRISYQINWFDGRTLNDKWVDASLLKPTKDKPTIKIGFN